MLVKGLASAVMNDVPKASGLSGCDHGSVKLPSTVSENPRWPNASEKIAVLK
jgi:hypothetical protein